MTEPLLTFPTSLCHRCAFLRVTGNKRGSQFLQCGEPSMPKYLPQPVMRCGRFSATNAGSQQ